MVVINSITQKFVFSIGGETIIYQIVSLMFIATFIFVFYKITT